jgi:Effector Associated Constant Component 1
MALNAVSVSLDRPDDLRPLAEWLRDQDELCDRVALVERPVVPGQMGGVLEAVQVVLTSGTATTLVTSLFAWLAHRRATSRVSLKFRTRRGDDITLTYSASDDVHAVLETVHKFVEEER